MVVTLRADKEDAWRQSRHEDWAAANATRSTGDAGVGKDAATDDTRAGLVANKGAKDPEGAFTSALHFAATLMPPAGEECCLPDWTADTPAEVPPAGLERVSATTLD
jgi:hypothetical protein